MSNVDIVLEKPIKKTISRSKKRLIFYSLMITLPVIQFCIFYLYLNFEAFTLGFQKYTRTSTGKFVAEFSLDNFSKIFGIIFNGDNIHWFTNSFVAFAFHTGGGMILSLTFSYYIYKKYHFAEFFRVVLFLPGIISSIVWTTIFSYFADTIYVAVSGSKLGLMENPDTALGSLVFFVVWIGFGANILLYSGAMSSINESIVESASLDGANFFQEFIHITFPMIFNTFTTFLITGLSTLFTQELSLYNFFGMNAPESVRTIGYYLYIQTLESDVWLNEAAVRRGRLTFSELSAFGLIITAITLPIIYSVKYLCKKFGPSVD